jgi:hypothetical protein
MITAIRDPTFLTKEWKQMKFMEEWQVYQQMCESETRV